MNYTAVQKYIFKKYILNPSWVLYKDSDFLITDIPRRRGKVFLVFFILFMIQKPPGELCTNFRFWASYKKVLTGESSCLLQQSVFVVLVLARPWALTRSWARPRAAAPGTVPVGWQQSPACGTAGIGHGRDRAQPGPSTAGTRLSPSSSDSAALRGQPWDCAEGCMEDTHCLSPAGMGNWSSGL